MTGIDRVEFAYFRALVAADGALFALARTRIGYVLLDRGGATAILHRATNNSWGAVDPLGRVSRGPEIRRRAEADLRRHARARCLPQRLAAMLRHHLPEGTTYLNTGHSNLTDRVISGLKNVPGLRIAVMVHDTIPLDFPEFQRPATKEKFRRFLSRISRDADLVIANSYATRADCEGHMRAFGSIPEIIVAPLGIEDVVPIRDKFPPDRPYFVCVGTIEPRKNHALLLDIWDQFAAAGRTAPRLLVCGQRGWDNEAVFARLNATNPLVEECAGLSDAEIAGLVKGSRGLLSPSLAEGYGLPPIEAAALGVPIVVNDLAIYRETLGDIPIYLEAMDVYSWRRTINQLTEQLPSPVPFDPPRWDTHFNNVFNLI